jgi:hypothetical protein
MSSRRLGEPDARIIAISAHLSFLITATYQYYTAARLLSMAPADRAHPPPADADDNPQAVLIARLVPQAAPKQNCKDFLISRRSVSHLFISERKTTPPRMRARFKI